MASKTGRILDALLFCTMSLTLPAAAQERTYSADSLMAAFEKGSKVSPKGTEIVFRDVVVESKNSKVIFKSSHNHKVICELVPSNENHNKPPSVGRELTVTGRVRGRGLLGNVTLDFCSVALVAGSPAAADPVPQKAASGTPDTVPVEDATPASLPEHLPEHIQEPAKKPATTRNIQPAKPSPGKVKQEAVVTTSEAGRQNQTTTTNSESRRDAAYRFYVLLVLSGALVYGILAKLLGSALRRLRYSKASSGDDTTEVRQAALELLLLKASKKKKA